MVCHDIPLPKLSRAIISNTAPSTQPNITEPWNRCCVQTHWNQASWTDFQEFFVFMVWVLFLCRIIDGGKAVSLMDMLKPVTAVANQTYYTDKEYLSPLDCSIIEEWRWSILSATLWIWSPCRRRLLTLPILFAQTGRTSLIEDRTQLSYSTSSITRYIASLPL